MAIFLGKQIPEQPIKQCQHGVMALKGPEEERRVKRRETDGTAFSIVSYLHGLNALGSWPRSVPVHIIKPHEEKEGVQEPQPGRGRGEAMSHSGRTPGSKGSLF